MIEFSEKDLQQLDQKGISQEKVLKQVETFVEGIPYVRLDAAALINEGISSFTTEQAQENINFFEEAHKAVSLLKFVPASGAASRMFKALFNFLEDFNPDRETYSAYLARTADKDIQAFFEGQKRLPFNKIVEDRMSTVAGDEGRDKYAYVQEMLDEDRLNYGFYPKGLLPFHNYGSYVATPFEEHLKEAADYASSGNEAQLHFTISPQHEKMFQEELERIEKRISEETSINFTVRYSFQSPATDTIAVTPENEPFRNQEGSLLFRPGGHGALIENLNEQEADLIFIKNIDNVAIPKVAREMGQSKKLLGGVLLNLQEKAFQYAGILDEEHINGESLDEIKYFLETELNVRFTENYSSFSIAQQLDILRDKINRPIRVCGMVKNEGEPGGGPFWIKDSRDNVSLQIVESAQVNLNDERQRAIFERSSHFNPVDLVCGTKNHKGEKYNLLNFIDPRQGFISEKTKDGKALKALELPGLWNGAMAFWNTVFVEVPLLTFNPVKTVNDLLKPAHQIS